LPAGAACSELPEGDEVPFKLFPERAVAIVSRLGEVTFGHGHRKAGIANDRHDE